MWKTSSGSVFSALVKVFCSSFSRGPLRALPNNCFIEAVEWLKHMLNSQQGSGKVPGISHIASSSSFKRSVSSDSLSSTSSTGRGLKKLGEK